MSLKVVVIGGTGIIGSKLVEKLRAERQEAVTAAPSIGVNTLTCEGLAEALKGAAVVVDVSNTPSREDADAMHFFETSTRNLLAYEQAAGVGHHVVLSVVGSERMPKSGYLRAKLAQETLIKTSSVPYSILRATQFFESLESITNFAATGSVVRLPPVLVRPMAAVDVACALCLAGLNSPLNATVEIAGPETFRLHEWARRGLAARQDRREVIAEPQARYYDIEVTESTLLPGSDAQLGVTRFEDWLGVTGQLGELRADSAVCQSAGRPPVATGVESRRPAGSVREQ